MTKTMKTLHLSIELMEDLHIGTGTGMGDIDALQARDRLDRPVLPSSHIKGMLLQTARDLLPLQTDFISQSDIDALFGRAGSGQGCLQLTSAYLSKGSNSDALDTLLWGSTRIDPAKGKAQDSSLRLVEYIPAGTQFILQALLPAQHEALLKTIIGRCTRLGAGRNRGYGLVQWSLVNPDRGNKRPLQIPHKAPGYPQRLRLLLRNLDPVCLAQTGHPGNLIGSDGFIRGRALRGSFAAACIAMGKPEWAQILLQPNLAWADALPLPENELSSQELQSGQVLPIALSIGTPKVTATQTQLPWWVLQTDAAQFGTRGEINQIDLRPGEQPPEKLKRPGTNEFLYRPNPKAPWQRYTAQMHERLRTSVQRPGQADEQALFSNEEIAEDTLFQTDLIVSTPEQAKALGQLVQALDDPHWLRAGRGGKPLKLIAAQWLPLQSHPPANSHTNSFTLLLLSDLIARDALGNFHDGFTAQALCQLVGLPVDSAITIDKNYSEGCNLYGFNALTGLPRMAQRGIKAGSIARISGADAAKLRNAIAGKHCLGESPEEGFGRFALDLAVRPDSAQNIASKPRSTGTRRHEVLCEQARDFARQYARAIAKPSDSQWGDFRNQVQSARSNAELMAVFTRIDEAAKRQGGKAWEGFAGSNCQALRNAVQYLPLADAQDLLDYFVRWQRVQKEQPKQHQENPA